MRRLQIGLVVVLLIGSIAASSVSASPAQSGQAQRATCFLAKTTFVFHAGLAFGAFHRYIYKPFKAGSFSGPDKVKTIAKAAIAAAFVYHELNEALKQAKCSHTLSVLVSPITAVLGTIQTAADKLKAGGVPDIASLGTAVDQIGQSASGAGTPIKDLVTNL